MKKGISIVSLVIVIIVMTMLATVVSYSGAEYFKIAEINSFTMELVNVQNAVDEYEQKYGKYPGTENYVFDTTNIKGSAIEQFATETVTDNKITFKKIDMSLINMLNLEYGNEKETDDVYVVSETTGKVYYLLGIEYDKVYYYTLTDMLYTLAEITPNYKVSENDVKVYDVLFTPSEIEFTNQPVSVEVKLPKDAINITVSTSDSKFVSEATTLGEYQIIKVNQSGDNKTGNYTIQVDYTYKESTKTSKYAVSNFDNISPVLNASSQIADGVKKITINPTDDISGVEIIKYELSNITDVTYFENYGKKLNGSILTMSESDVCSIYAKDKAGNIVMQTI